MKYTYFKGNKAKYIGRMAEGFYELLMLEGHDKGKIKLTSKSPDGVDLYAQRAKKEWLECQSDFRKLRS